MVPSADPPAPPPNGAPTAAGRDPAPAAGVRGVDMPCARAGPPPTNATMAAASHMRPIDPIAAADARRRSARGTAVMWKLVIDRSNQAD